VNHENKFLYTKGHNTTTITDHPPSTGQDAPGKKKCLHTQDQYHVGQLITICQPVNREKGITNIYNEPFGNNSSS
jgi:hypothetical protein